MTHRKLPVIKLQQYHLLIEALYFEAAEVNKIALDSKDVSAREAFEAKRQALNELAQFIVDGSTTIIESDGQTSQLAAIEAQVLQHLREHPNPIDGRPDLVGAIKLYRNLTGDTLKGAKERVEALMAQHGIVR